MNETLRIAPDNASAISAKGSFDEQLGRKAEARASYSRALAIKPDLEDAKRGLERLTLTALTDPPSTSRTGSVGNDNSQAEPAQPVAVPPEAPTPQPRPGTSVATLYKITSPASGEHRTNTSEFSSLALCKAAVRLFRSQAPLRDKTRLYCNKHATPPLSQR